tara:strand:- start:307 stop:417 length:111 start_codon:yes stop_codon:yes gene_type:complete
MIRGIMRGAGGWMILRGKESMKIVGIILVKEKDPQG